MELQQRFEYYQTQAGSVYSSSRPTVTLIPNRLLGSDFDIGSSPFLRFSNQLDSRAITPFQGNDQEQHGSSDNLASPHRHELGNSNACACKLSKLSKDDHCSSNLLWRSAATSPFGSSSRKLEATLMVTDNGDKLPYSISSKDSNEHVQVQRPGEGSQENRGSPFILPQSSVVTWDSQFNEVVQRRERRKVMNKSQNEIRGLLINCARAFSENNIDEFDKLAMAARSVLSVNGGPIQRLGSYLIQGLIARKDASERGTYRSLDSKEPKDLMTYLNMFHDICPYLKFSYMAANGAIVEACRHDDCVHIIDFRIAQGAQWATLLQAFAGRPGGAPRVRITAIDDSCGGGLEAVARRLAKISEGFNIPLEFNGLPVVASDVTRDMLDIRPGEALAVNFPLQLHRTPDESVDMSNPRDGLLRMVRSLSPKVTTLIEQESNTNTSPFLPRFVETLDYYSAMLESIYTIIQRDDGDKRTDMEEHWLAGDIVNIIACEGKERVERREVFGKWRSRLQMAGFRQRPMNAYVGSVIRSLLRLYSEHFSVEERDGAVLLGWKQRNMISASAWH